MTERGQLRVGGPTSKSEQDRKRLGKRWTLEQARQVMEQWKASGKSAVAFAAEHGFSAPRLSYWSKQIEAVASKAPKFVAVPIDARIPTTSRSARAVEIVVAGLMLRVGDEVDVRYVARLVAALQSRGVEGC